MSMSSGPDHRNQEELRQTVERFRVALKNSQVVVFNQDRDLRYTWLQSPTFDWAQQDCVGKTDAEILGTENARPLTTIKQRVVDTGVGTREEVTLVFDGKKHYLDLTVEPMRAPDGLLTGITCAATEITARKQAEQTLLLQSAALDSAANAIVITDLDGAIQWVNPAFTELTGYSVEEVIGKNPRLLKSCVQDGAFYQDLWTTIRSGKVWHGEITNRRKDGTLYTEEMTITPVRADGREVTHFIAIKQDVTARIQSQDALRISEERFRHLVENSSDGILLLNPEGTILYASESAVRVSGFPRRELVGRNVCEFIHAEDRPAARQTFANCLGENAAPSSGEYRVQHKDNSWRYFEGTATNRQHEPSVQAIVFNFRDTTERRCAEEALRQTEEKYREIVENAVVGIFQTTPDGRYLKINRALADMYGSDSPEQRMEAVNDIGRQVYVDPSRREQFKREMQQHGILRNFEYEVYRRDGSRMWLMENSRAVRDASGNVLYYEGTVEDITQRKLLEEQLRQAQKLEAVGRLAGGVAHDFNNMLGVIIGYSELLQERCKLDNSMQKGVAEIKKAANRAASLTRQLLAFSRKQVLQSRVLNLNETLSDISRMLHRLIGDDVEVITKPGSDLGLVKADPGQIEQVIMNLAVNARDAMPHGGKLVLKTENVQIGQPYADRHLPVVPGSYVLLSVTDSGCGMDADTISHIFEPFFTTKEQGKGTGLGLSIVYGIVKQSGGYIWVYSEPGRGTTFKIYLPTVFERDAEPVRDRRPTTWLTGTETILVVEDEPSLCDMARSILESAGYTVLEAHSGEEGLRAVERHPGPIDLVLSDVILRGGMNGHEMAGRLFALHPEARVVYMSGYSGELISWHGLLDPGTDLLEKPFDTDSLQHKVREVLDREPGRPDPQKESKVLLPVAGMHIPCDSTSAHYRRQPQPDNTNRIGARRPRRG